MQTLVELTDVPVSGVFASSSEATAPRRNLDFDYCPRCSFVMQRPWSGGQIDYSLVGRATARQLPAYASALVERLLTLGRTARVVEVGCNDGTFLNALRDAGFGHLLGIEPSAALAAYVREQGHTVIAQPLDLAMAEVIRTDHGAADIVVCRHTLEHVPAPTEFLAALHSLLNDQGLLCLEVPSLKPVIEGMHIHEIWDEHISYFLPETLASAMRQAGFAIEEIRVEPYREMQNIIVWARRGTPMTESPLSLPSEVALCASFASRWEAIKQQVCSVVQQAPAPRVAIGASHPQTNFINFLGLGAVIDYVIDDDPYKCGKHLPLNGRTVAIHSSESLPVLCKGGTVLLTGFGYPQWMTLVAAVSRQSGAVVVDIAGMAPPVSLIQPHQRSS